MAISAYVLTDGPEVVRTADGAVIPNDPLNMDRVEYSAWLAAGNVPDPFIPPVVTPHVDANVRIDAGIVAAVDVAVTVRDAMQNIPDHFTATNFAAMKIQLDALTQAFAAMLQAQAPPQPQPPP